MWEESEVRPFGMAAGDVEALLQSEGFSALRRYLARDTSFCAQHSACDGETKETWILQRDLLHALVAPVLELFRRAARLAQAALCSARSEDLELAFAGEARGAFLCLQCFVDEEEDWCRTRGCAACITSATLSTESHLRLTIAASLLSTATASAQSESAEQVGLPPLPHVLPALREALAADPFWGADAWPYLLGRATQLARGMQGLMGACGDLESLVSSPVSSPRGFVAQGEKGVRLRKSKLAKRQLRLEREEVEMMRRMAMQCWARARMPRARGVVGEERGRRRSLTCP